MMTSMVVVYLWHLNVNRKELIRLIRGTTVKHIHNSEIKNIELCMPQSLEEQTQIAVTFKTLDNRIDLHQRQTQKLTELKTGLLQKISLKIANIRLCMGDIILRVHIPYTQSDYFLYSKIHMFLNRNHPFQ